MVAKGRCDDAGADHDPAGASPNGAHPGEGIGSVSARVTPWLEMIADKNRVESDLLRNAGKLQQFGGRKLFSRRLVTNLQHKHSISSRADHAATNPRSMSVGNQRSTSSFPPGIIPAKMRARRRRPC